MSHFTYPPELLPSLAEGEEADIVVVDPDSGLWALLSDEQRTQILAYSGTMNFMHQEFKRRLADAAIRKR